MHRKKFKKTVLGLLLTILFVAQTAGYVQAGRWDLDMGLTVTLPRHVIHMFYLDEDGNSIGNDRTIGPFPLETEEELEQYELEIDDIYGYDYVSCYYEDVNSGYISPVFTERKIFRVDQFRDENYVEASNIYERNVYVKYKRDISKIRYNFNVKYVDETGEVQLKDSYTEDLVGSGSAFSPEIAEIADYEYKGYYYKNLSDDAYSKGSLDELLKEPEPVIATEQNGNDTKGVDCAYEVYAVYIKKEVPEVSTYTVTYDANGAAGTVKDESEYQSGAEVTVLKADSLTLEGFLFDGWNTQKDGEGTSYKPEDTFEITEDVTLYAQWKESKPDTKDNTDDEKNLTPTPTVTATPQTRKPTSPTYKSGTTTTAQVVKTGDEAPTAVYGLAAILAGAVIIYKARNRKKLNVK